MNHAERKRARAHTEAIRALTELTRSPITLSCFPAAQAPSSSDGAPRSARAGRDHRLYAFVERALCAYESVPGLLHLEAMVFPSSRSTPAETAWVTTTHVLEQAELDLARERAVPETSAAPVEIGAEVWAAAHPIGAPSGSGREGVAGTLLGVFDSDEAAAGAAGDLEVLADDLALGLQLRRQALESETLVRLSSALSEAGTHHEALHWMAELLCEMTRSDGAKVFVLRRTHAGPRIERLYRTDSRDERRRRYGISQTYGLADWVFLHNDWLLIPSASRGKDEREIAITGAHGTVEILARPGEEHDASEPVRDRERTLLLAPLRIQGKALGVLSLWRLTDHPYDLERDRPSVDYVARHLASACRELIHAEVMEQAVKQVSRVGRLVAFDGDSPTEGPSTTPDQIYLAVAEAAGRLAHASRAVLLLHDDRRPGFYYSVAVWTEARLLGQGGTEPTFAVDATRAPQDWEQTLRDALLGSAEGPPPAADAFAIRRVLPLPPAMRAGDDAPFASPPPAAALVLLDQASTAYAHSPTCDDGLAEQAAEMFVDQVGPTVLVSYPGAFAQKVANELGHPVSGGGHHVDKSPEELLRTTGDLLRRRTRCDAVLVYRGDLGGMVVSNASPPLRDLIGLPAGAHTQESVLRAEPILVRDASDAGDPQARAMDHAALRRIAEAYGWDGVRSWLCYPLIESGRCLGLLKLVTKKGGRFLDPCSFEVVRAVAARAAGEMHRLTRTTMLEELNHLAVQLGGRERDELSGEMGRGLEKWARRFLQPDCHVAVIATVSSPQPRLFASCPHIDRQELESENEQAIRALGAGPPSRGSRASGSSGVRLTLRGRLHGRHQLVVPVHAVANKSLSAWLFFFGAQPFSKEDSAVAREAAREMALLLDYEHRRHIWAHQVARFRHAVIGPVQGLTSAARMLCLVSGDPPTELVKKLRARVEEEAEATRLWRENQRIYMNETVDVALRAQPLRPVIERCYERFVNILSGRGIKSRLNWRSQGSLDFPFDEAAIDLIVTNLLDNARKYAFYNRPIEMGVEVDGAFVRIWVEDIGHGIPDRLRQSIYEVGGRLDWKDPIRAIDGTGLGLPMARALVKAHGGDIHHTSLSLGTSKEGSSEVYPHRVRFVVELPHQWRPR